MTQAQVYLPNASMMSTLVLFKHSDQSEKARRAAEILCAVLSIPTPPNMLTRYDTMQLYTSLHKK